MQTKFFNFLFILGITFPLMSTISSCSSDNDDEGSDEGSEFDTPLYNESAAKYNIQGDDTYESIEFTESGNYIIIYKSTSTTSYTRSICKKTNKLSILVGNMLINGKPAKTRSDFTPYSPILYGKYTKTDDNTYMLDNGTVVVITSDESENVFSIEISENGKQPQIYSATKQNRDLNSTNSNKLCRTWSISALRFYYKCNGITLFDETTNTAKELQEKLTDWFKKNVWDEEDEEDEEIDFWYISAIDAVQQVVFTKTGTYLVCYEDSQLAVSTWRWYNEQETILQYSWDNNFENGIYDGFVNIEFKNNQLIMGTEAYYHYYDYDDYDGEIEEIEEELGFFYFMDEVK